MADRTHKDLSTRKSLLTLVNTAGYSISQAALSIGVPVSTAHRWVQLSREGVEHRRPGSGRRRVSTPEQNAALVAEAVRNPFQSASAIRTNSQFPGSTRTALRRLKDEQLFARIAAKKELLKDEHKLFRLAFSEENTNRNWNRVIFSDEVTFSSTNGGKVIVYRPRGARYDERYVAKQIRRGRVSVSCWGWMCRDGLGVLWMLDETLNAAQYKVILEHVMIPSVRMHYPDGIIDFVQDNHPVHTSNAVSNWFSERQDIKVMDWPPCSPDLNPIEHVWAEVKKEVESNWPANQRRTKDALWTQIQEAWDRVSTRRRYCRNLISSMPRRLREVIWAEGSHTRY